MKYCLCKRFYRLIILISSGHLISYHSFSQVAEFSKSYINITKGPNGGTIENGDVLEIRATFAVRSGSFDSCAYYDVIPTGTTYLSNTIRVLTNEGKIYKQFTDALNDDAGWINGSAIRINLGYNPVTSFATANRRGTVSNSDKPSYFNTACIMVASFRVTVTSSNGTNISVGGGSITLKNGLNPLQTYTFQPNTLRVSANYGLSTGVTGPNLFTAEFNGSFGTGKPRNRGSSAYIPTSYTYQVFNTGSPNDNGYGIANNTSTRLNYTSLNIWPNPDTLPPSHRVFSVWDIIGDHTGSASATLGNPAADTVANSNAGYMLIVNSAYKTDSTFQVTVNGLCPNTLYDISGWFRNICPKCGCDSNGRAASQLPTSPLYIPTASGDSSGVAPHLIFEINGIDFYTTGNISYTGQWIKKGFSFLTGALQTSFVLRIFNDAPAGSGNDWALDDISVNMVSPTMRYAPGTSSFVCKDNSVTIYDTIRSAAGNYVYYKWQRSTDNGSSWADITSALGPASPALNGSLWRYVTSYTIPAAWTTLSDSADLYRVIVSGTSGNLSSSSCSYTDTTALSLNVNDCGVPLDITLLSFRGAVKNSIVSLNWTTTGEKEFLRFEIEKSINNSPFKTIYSVNGTNEGLDAINNYSWNDPDILKEKTYYRLKISNKEGLTRFSRIAAFGIPGGSFEIVTINNPFNSALLPDVYTGINRVATIQLADGTGKPVRIISCNLLKGMNALKIENISVLQAGIYILSIYSNGEMITRKLIKQ